eukprot:scaffold25269_cov112-Isochrysis_galbana.AAC.2
MPAVMDPPTAAIEMRRPLFIDSRTQAMRASEPACSMPSDTSVALRSNWLSLQMDRSRDGVGAAAISAARIP